MVALWGFIRAWWKPLLFLAAVGFALYYRASLTKAEASLTEVNRELSLAKSTMKDMETRQRDVAALDAKYTQELADAQSTINQLERDVATGKRRLQLNATCKSNSTGTTGMDDASTAELTPDARQNYFHLREQLVTAEKQILGLQEYIRTVVFDEMSKSNQ
ncbi:lysis protein [Cronobacter dublinensis]|uniref:lysis protein n=1 Tax=Cronobacter dublinensis TaxID=413497 RepID=UPI00039D0F02|nr:lysis protein [Cronobacter dublinensis]ALB67167.1 lysozyme [Cronobacter dublinensis subsp. dublinensis LMG 23823]MDI7270790.1 lysis protein [Cronobacter dublinensis]